MTINGNAVERKPRRAKKVITGPIAFDERAIERVEKKYLITKREKNTLLRAINKNLEHDEFYKEEVLSIYFDTKNSDLAIRSIDRPNYRAKIRARVYIDKEDHEKKSLVFLEVKSKLALKKTKIGNKRRLSLDEADFERFMNGEKLMTIAEEVCAGSFQRMQIAKELAYLMDYYKLEPKVLISADRLAFSSKYDPEFRLTFDENLRFRTKDLTFRKGSKGKKYFPTTDEPKKSVIMEVKTMNAMPPWFVKELSRLMIYPTRFSKYGKIYQLINERNN